MNFLLLAELVNRTSISSGQLIIPLSDLELNYQNLEEILKQTLSEYQRYKPYYRKETMFVDQNGTSLPGAKRVISMRPYVSNMFEYLRPIPFKAFELYDGVLKTVYGGNFVVEYIAEYPLTNYPVSYIQTFVNEFESDFKFKLRGHFKKGTLKIRILQPDNTSVFMTEDFSSYKPLISSFTYDESTNILSIDEKLGKWLKTGSSLKTKTTGTLPNPLVHDSNYFVIRISDTEIKLTDTIDKAFANISFDLQNTSTGILSVESIVNQPELIILGDMGYGKINLQTLETEINLVDSFEGQLKIEFTSLYPAVEGLDINNAIFLDLFKGNVMMSLGLIKEILKLPDLPFDFTADTIYNRGEEIKKDAMKLLEETSDWHLFRA